MNLERLAKEIGCFIALVIMATFLLVVGLFTRAWEYFFKEDTR